MSISPNDTSDKCYGLSTVNRATDNRPQNRHLSLNQVERLLDKCGQKYAQKDGPAIIASTFNPPEHVPPKGTCICCERRIPSGGQDCTAPHKTRCSDGWRDSGHVEVVHWLFLDFDTADGAIDDICQALDGLTQLRYSTWSHGDASKGTAPRFRVLIPLARPVTPDEYAVLWQVGNDALGGTCDKGCKDTVRLMYLPRRRNPASTVEPWITRLDGAELNPDTLPDGWRVSSVADEVARLEVEAEKRREKAAELRAKGLTGQSADINSKRAAGWAGEALDRLVMATDGDRHHALTRASATCAALVKAEALDGGVRYDIERTWETLVTKGRFHEAPDAWAWAMREVDAYEFADVLLPTTGPDWVRDSMHKMFGGSTVADDIDYLQIQNDAIDGWPQWCGRLSVGGAQGSGKSTRARCRCAQLDGVKWFMCPSIDLAAEQADKFTAEHGAGAVVVRGRGKELPDGTPMCQRAEVAEQVAKAGLSVQATLCDGCPFYAACEYQKQREALRDASGVTCFMAHEYLFSQSPAPKPDAIIIDEECATKFASTTTIAPSDLDGDIQGAAREALQGGKPLLAELRQRGVTAVGLQVEARKLRDEINAVTAMINGQMSDALIGLQLAAVDMTKRRIARVLETLAAELATGRDTSTGVAIEKRDGGDVVVCHYRKRFTYQDVPLLLLDGTGSHKLQELAFGEVEHVWAPVRRDARVVQTSRDFSKKSLLENTTTDATLRDDAVEFAMGLEGETLMVMPLKVRAALGDIEDDDGLVDKIGGVHLAHFGRLRGIDKWKGVDNVVVLSRELPRVEDVEATARGLTYDRPEVFDSAGTYVHGFDGVYWPVNDTAKEVLRQAREAEILQAIDRARPHFGHHVDVYLLNNVPLPGVVPDEVVKWGNLRDGVAGSQSRFVRTMNALGFWPDSPAMLAKLCPEIWTVRTAKRFAPRIAGWLDSMRGAKGCQRAIGVSIAGWPSVAPVYFQQLTAVCRIFVSDGDVEAVRRVFGDVELFEEEPTRAVRVADAIAELSRRMSRPETKAEMWRLIVDVTGMGQSTVRRGLDDLGDDIDELWARIELNAEFWAEHAEVTAAEVAELVEAGEEEWAAVPLAELGAFLTLVKLHHGASPDLAMATFGRYGGSMRFWANRQAYAGKLMKAHLRIKRPEDFGMFDWQTILDALDGPECQIRHSAAKQYDILIGDMWHLTHVAETMATGAACPAVEIA